MKKSLITVSIFLLTVPTAVFSADTLQSITAGFFIFINNYLVPFTLALAVFVLLFGILKFVIQAGSQEGREQGQRLIFWGVIAIVIMTSVWGLVKFIAGDLGISGVTEIPKKTPGN